MTRVIRKRLPKTGMPPAGSGSEHWHQSRFFSVIRQIQHPYAKSAAEITYAIPNGFLRTSKMRIRAWQEGVLKGVWDVHLPLPTTQFPGLWLEFKAGRNGLTAEQQTFGERMGRYGFRTEVVRSWQDGVRVWLDYLGLGVSFDEDEE